MLDSSAACRRPKPTRRSASAPRPSLSEFVSAGQARSLARELDMTTGDVFHFGGEHCDRVVAGVLARCRALVAAAACPASAHGNDSGEKWVLFGERRGPAPHLRRLKKPNRARLPHVSLRRDLSMF